jgi:hypothetical protein
MTRSHPVFVTPLFAELKAAVAGVADMPLESPEMPAGAVLVAKRADMPDPPSALELAERAKNRCQRGNLLWQRHNFPGIFAPCTQCGQVRG